MITRLTMADFDPPVVRSPNLCSDEKCCYDKKPKSDFCTYHTAERRETLMRENRRQQREDKLDAITNAEDMDELKSALRDLFDQLLPKVP